MPDDQIGTQTTVLESPASRVTSSMPAYLGRTKAIESFDLGATAQIPATPTTFQAAYIQRSYLQAQSEAPALHTSVTYRIAKRALDLFLAVPALIALLPMFAVIAVIVRLDSPGPAFFIQRRVGKDGKIFSMFKFRTMQDNAGVLDGPLHKQEDDSRVTRVGGFLRRTSIDELPQLVNVILGQMSLVGPRPELPEIAIQRYQRWQYRRLAVPQGITGWWQVTGRGKKMLWKHTRDDLYYIERASFWFDLKLILMTLQTVVRREGAF